MLNDCEICGEVGKRIDLAGGFPIVLCMKCQRQWDDFCKTRQEFDSLMDSRAELTRAEFVLQGGSFPAILFVDSEKKYRAARTEMYTVAKRWLADQQQEYKEQKGKELRQVRPAVPL